ncbi:MAG: hypothetical protein VKJ02_11760 [Snowella sp.]|nr:hypothetical protein [Snowella sp.]
MGKSKEFNEYDFLDLFYQEMLERGQPINLIVLSIDARMVCSINEKFKISVTQNSLQKIADICLANSWIKYISLGGQYRNLQLTTTGFGVVKSKRKQVEQLSNRSIFKKASDYIEDHKGLFILFGFIIGLAGLFINFYRNIGHG